MKSDEEGMIGGCLEDSLLRLNPVNVLILIEHLLLDDLDRIDLARLLVFRLYYLKFETVMLLFYLENKLSIRLKYLLL